MSDPGQKYYKPKFISDEHFQSMTDEMWTKYFSHRMLTLREEDLVDFHGTFLDIGGEGVLLAVVALCAEGQLADQIKFLDGGPTFYCCVNKQKAGNVLRGGHGVTLNPRSDADSVTAVLASMCASREAAESPCNTSCGNTSGSFENCLQLRALDGSLLFGGACTNCLYDSKRDTCAHARSIAEPRDEQGRMVMEEAEGEDEAAGARDDEEEDVEVDGEAFVGPTARLSYVGGGARGPRQVEGRLVIEFLYEQSDAPSEFANHLVELLDEVRDIIENRALEMLHEEEAADDDADDEHEGDGLDEGHRNGHDGRISSSATLGTLFIMIWFLIFMGVLSSGAIEIRARR